MRHFVPCFKLYERTSSLLLRKKSIIKRSLSTFGISCCQKEPPKQKNSQVLVIGTHDGQFHCDEVLACWMLKQLPQYKDATIVRTREPSKLDNCDIVIDVGGVYDPENERFDHHQRSFGETMKSLGGYRWTTKLSSCGLIYFHLGKDVISELSQISKDNIIIEKLYKKIYSRFIEEVDAVDNSIDQYDGVPRYQVSTTLAARVRRLNPIWSDVNPDVTQSFEKAMSICGDEFIGQLNFLTNAWLPALQIVKDAVEKRYSDDSSGEIISLFGGCPWEEHLFSIERELGIRGAIKFVLYPDRNGDYRVHAVRKRFGMFGHRLGLCDEWCGLRDKELSNLTGIQDCIFVHISGFIGGNKTYAGALEMARLSLNAMK